MNAIAEYEYFRVFATSLRPGRKTHKYEVLNRRRRTLIGVIQWYGPWRQFCFFPERGTVWSAGCLADMQDAIAKVKEHHQQAQAET